MISLVWRTDVHFASDSPASRLDDWQATVTDKLVQVGMLAKKVGAAAVLDGGDFFHIKAPTRTPHALVAAVGSIHADYPCPVYANVGNHDLSHDNMSTLAKQPLGSVFAHGTFKRLDDVTFTDSEGFKVRVIGFPFKRLWSIGDFDLERGDEDFLVVCLHLLASPSGKDMFPGEPVLAYRDIPLVLPKADVVCIGHWHQDQGITQIDGGPLVVNTGSLTRGALTEDEMARKPKAVVLKFVQGALPTATAVEIKVEAAEVVFDVKGRDTKRVEEKHMEDFVRRLQEQAEDLAEVDLPEQINHLGQFAQKVRDRALSYLARHQ